MGASLPGGFERRDFLKVCMAAAGAVAVESLLTGCSYETGMANAGGLTRYTGASNGFAAKARPIVGTGWHGHTFPGATAPFGLVQLSPDTVGPPEPKWNGTWDIYAWDHCGGYHYSDNTILGFSHTHISGTGVQELGDVLVMPLVEGRNWAWDSGAPGKEHQAQIQALGPDSGWVSRNRSGYASRFSHQKETAQVGYYGVYLETPRVKAELTATTRCGMHRYTYPALPDQTRRGMMLDLVHGLGNPPYHAELTIESPTRISGKRYSHGWAKNRQAYFVMEFSAPLQWVDVMVDGRITRHPGTLPRHFSGVQIKAIFQWHASEVNHHQPLKVRVGISGTGVDGAERNLSTEIPHWDFDSVCEKTRNIWNRALGVLQADLPTSELSETFYSSVYHCMMGPTTFNDVNGTFRGEDFKNHPNPGFTNYTTMSIWDIYRGEFPFIMLTQPHRTNDIINTLLTDYRQLNQQSLPMWPLWANETWCMTGFHVVAMIVGAYTRGFRGYNVPALYAAMRETALVGATANGNRELQKQFMHYGYVPMDGANQSVSHTLDFAYDYWCMGAMAELLGKHDDAAMFYKLGQNYKNLFDPGTGFMRGRSADGKWQTPFRPDEEYWQDYTESDAWEATFNVMQDVQGLIDLYGGDQQFIAKLDAYFTAPSKVYNTSPDVSGMVGQDAQGNEPSNHIPYLYPPWPRPIPCWVCHPCENRVLHRRQYRHG